MLSYIVRRFILAIITVIAITMLSFVIIQLPPGDFVTTYLINLESSGSVASEGEAEIMRAEYGLDKPMYVQYLKWMGMVMHGNFGMALAWNKPVKDVIGDRLSLTVLVSVFAIMITWMVALPIGIYSAVRQYSIGDFAFTAIGFIGIAVPNFMLALICMYFGYKYFHLSIGGLFSAQYVDAPWSWARFADLMKHMILPSFILGLAGTAQLIRIMRANLLDELRKPYVVTARAKGLAESRIILKYPVRAALNPFASTIGYYFPYVVSGSIIVSLVLGLPTVGPLLLTSLTAQDMFLAGTIILMLGVMTVIGTFVSDLILMWIDPRIRMEG